MNTNEKQQIMNMLFLEVNDLKEQIAKYKWQRTSLERVRILDGIKKLEHDISEYSWQLFPESMGS